MTLHSLNRKKIIDVLLTMRKNYDGSDSQFAKMWGIHPTAFSQIKQGKIDNIIGDDKLVSIGRKLNVALLDTPDWNIVKTETFEFVSQQLALCQRESAARILCDMAGIGKTTAAKEYMLKNRNVFYVDCSQNKTKRQFIKAIAKAIGVGTGGSMSDIIADIKYCLTATVKPLVILDELGDLENEAFVEIKALWNGTEGACGWYAMGADGLRVKIERGIDRKRVGFVEFYRRFGEDFMTVRPPMNEAEKAIFISEEAKLIIKGNMPGAKLMDLLPKSETKGTIYSLTRLKERIIKIKRDEAQA